MLRLQNARYVLLCALALDWLGCECRESQFKYSTCHPGLGPLTASPHYCRNKIQLQTQLSRDWEDRLRRPVSGTESGRTRSTAHFARFRPIHPDVWMDWAKRSEEHTSELQSPYVISYAV